MLSQLDLSAIKNDHAYRGASYLVRLNEIELDKDESSIAVFLPSSFPMISSSRLLSVST